MKWVLIPVSTVIAVFYAVVLTGIVVGVLGL